MKTKIIVASIILFALLYNNKLHAQSSTANYLLGIEKFLGYDAGQNFEFRTNNPIRMQQMQTGTSFW